MSYIFKAALFLLLFSDTVIGCTFPGSGPTYDKLIVISELEEKNHFSVKFPNELSDGEGVFVSLDYSKPVNSNEPLIFSDENYIVLYSYSYLKQFWDFITFTGRKEITIEFEAEYREGFIANVNAHWPGLCSSYGKSKPLNVKP